MRNYTGHGRPVSMHANCKALLQLALPMIASAMLTFSMQVTDLFMVGHLGTSELAAAAIGNTFFQLLQHPVFGFATALDTLLSQAFGAGQLDAYGRWTQATLRLEFKTAPAHCCLTRLECHTSV